VRGREGRELVFKRFILRKVVIFFSDVLIQAERGRDRETGRQRQRERRRKVNPCDKEKEGKVTDQRKNLQC
jgi:hypothetical protein